MSKEKIMLIGAKGFVGQNLLFPLLDQGYLVVPFTRCQGRIGPLFTKKLDLEDSNEVKNTIRFESPDIILNCAGLIGIQQCEDNPKLAKKLNYDAVETIADTTLSLQKGSILHMSTDAVFTGNQGSNFDEYDIPNPSNEYGRTKRQGESVLLDTKMASQIVRTCVVYGKTPFIESPHPRFIDTVLNHLKSGREFHAMSDSYFNPIDIESLVGGILFLISRINHLENQPDIIHLAGPDRMSKYEFALAIAKAFDFDSQVIKPKTISEVNKLYGRDTSLSSRKLARMGYRPDNVRKGLLKYKAS